MPLQSNDQPSITGVHFPSLEEGRLYVYVEFPDAAVVGEEATDVVVKLNGKESIECDVTEFRVADDVSCLAMDVKFGSFSFKGRSSLR